MNKILDKTVLLCILMLPLYGFAGTEHKVLPFTKTKSIERSFPLKAQTQVEVVSKYGDIKFRNWDKDSVRFEVNVIAESDQEDYAEMLLGLAEIKFIAAGGSVRSELAWGEQLNAVKRNSMEMMLNLKKNHRIRIDHVVYLPKSTSVLIENRFGDVEMEAITGKLIAKVHHGDFRAGLVSEARLLNVKYGRIEAEEITVGEIQLSFGSMNLPAATELRIQSSGSEIRIGSAGQLNVKSSNDKFDIEKLHSLSGNSSLTSFRIRELLHAIDFDIRFGDIVVRKISRDYDHINLQSGSSDIELIFDPAASFGFDLDLDNVRSLVINSASKKITNDSQIEKRRIISGSFGKQNDSPVKVKLRTKAGNVRMEQ